VKTLGMLLGAAALGVLAALAALGLYRQFGPDAPGTQAVEAGPQQLPAFAFADLESRMRRSTEWADRILVINFWATWCPPCRRELPVFAELQSAYGERGVQFLAVAIDDAEQVRDFAAKHPFNFPVLLGDDAAVTLAKHLGNRVASLPYTVVVDRSGAVRARHVGEYRRDDLERTLAELVGG
jgi:thiol-disulfide isomerase/thioredoxin